MNVYFERPPAEIEDDKTYLWHGTSNIYEKSFESDSPSFNRIATFEDLEYIINIYNQMNWSGNHGGGFAVLSTFSTSNFLNPERKDFFLGETFPRVTRYASKDFAGGEMIRSVYHAYKDLLEYFNRTEWQDNHREFVAMENENLHFKKFINLDGIDQKIKLFGSKFQLVETLVESYQYGIAYGFKINPADFIKLEWRNGMGIASPNKPEINISTVKIIIRDDYVRMKDEKRGERGLYWGKVLGRD